MAQKRAVRKTGKKAKPRSRNSLERSGKKKAAKRTAGAKKSVRTAGAEKPVRAASAKKPARKTAASKVAAKAKRGMKQPARKTSAVSGGKQAAIKARAPLPKKVTAQKKPAARPARKPASVVDLREVQSTAPAAAGVMPEALAGQPLTVSEVAAAASETRIA